MNKMTVKSGTGYALLLAAAVFVMMLLTGCGQQQGTETVQIMFFHSNPCESCKEEEKFAEIVKEKLLADKEEFPYEYQVFSTMKTSGRERYQKELDRLGINKEKAQCPLMVIGNRYVSGYDLIGQNINTWVREAAANDAGYTAWKDSGNTDSTSEFQTAGNETGAERGEGLMLFTTFSCTECEKVKKQLDISKEWERVTEYNISETSNSQLMLSCFEQWNVPAEDQQVPILLWDGGYASGSEDILNVMKSENWSLLTPGDAPKLRQEGGSAIRELSFQDFWKLIGAGLLNGLNPCALSMLFFLLSLLSSSQQKTGRLGGAYLAGKFLAYLGMGAGLITLLSSMEGMLLRIYSVMKVVLLLAAAVLAVMNFLDAVHVIKKEYGKVKVQLPASLRKWNQGMIRKLGSRGGKGLWLVIFFLGMIISAGEFFCTGQIYAATLLMLFQTGSGLRIMVFLAILCYVTALCIPSAVCLSAAAKGKSVLAASDKALKYMPAIKLANGLIFLLFAIFFAFG